MSCDICYKETPKEDLLHVTSFTTDVKAPNWSSRYICIDCLSKKKAKEEINGSEI